MLTSQQTMTMMTMRSIVFLLLAASTSALRSFVPKENLPDGLLDYEADLHENEEWVSLDEHTEFLPSQRILMNNPYAAQTFADGETEYDGK